MTLTGEMEMAPSLPEVLGIEIDEARRTIYLFEEICAPLLRRLVPALDRMVYDREGEENGRIQLIAGSLGGSDTCMFALVDLIRSLPVPVDIIALGSLSSAASGLLAVCAQRSVGEHTEVCLHGFTASLQEGDYDHRDLTGAIHRMEAAARMYARLLAGRSNLTADHLLDITLARVPERRLVGAAIVTMGLADEVLRPASPHTETSLDMVAPKEQSEVDPPPRGGVNPARARRQTGRPRP